MKKLPRTRGCVGAVILSTLMLGTSCSNAAAPCFGVPTPSFVIHALSSASGESLDGRATLTIAELQQPFETFTGPLSNEPPSKPIAATSDHIGRFAVTIEVPGFRTWKDTVEVMATNTSCPRPATATVLAKLDPIS